MPLPSAPNLLDSDLPATASPTADAPGEEIATGRIGATWPERRDANRRRARNLTLPLVLTGSLAASMQIALPAAAHSPSAPSPRASVPAPTPPKVSPTPLVVQAAPAQYTVESGDSISGIASKFGLATASVLALNGLGWSSLIFPGQVLLLTGAAATPGVETPAPAPAPSTAYAVVSGDTISAIAHAHGVTTAAVYAANGLSSASIIYPGQSIQIPGAPAPAPTPAPAPAPAPPATAPEVPQTPTESTVTPMSAEMRQNAAIIVSTARSIGVSDYGIVIALATAAQESSLRNVQHGDRDSLGLFQQRPSMGWGTVEQVLDPVRATKAFFGGHVNPNPGLTTGLLDIDGWESLSVTAAAQAVQKSAHPDLYTRWEASARAWLAELG